MKKLENKVALTTGEGSGMVRAQAIHFAEVGAKIIASDINFKRDRKAVEEIRFRGGGEERIPQQSIQFLDMPSCFPLTMVKKESDLIPLHLEQ